MGIDPGLDEGSLSESPLPIWIRDGGGNKTNGGKKPKPENPNDLKTRKPKEFLETSSFFFFFTRLLFSLTRLVDKTGCFPF